MNSYFRIFSTWLVIFLVGLKVYSVSQGRIWVSENLEKSLNWFPNYSEGLLNLNDRILEESLSEKSAEKIKQNSIQALKSAPLTYRPFLHLAEANVFRNENDEAQKLFLAAKARNSRNRRTLRALSNLSIKDQKFGEAVQNLDILLRLKGREQDFKSYQQALTSLSSNPQALKEIDHLLSQRPPWGARYLNNQMALMTAKNYLNIGHSLTTYTQKIDEKKSDKNLNAHYLNKLIRMNKFEEAYQFWEGLFGSEKPNTLLYNTSFEKRTALPPYNWSEIDRLKYFSEIDQGGGLYASFSDNKTRTLTEQIVRLAPGSVYRMAVDAEWSYRQRQGMFFWVITCLQNGSVISGVNLDDQAKKNSGGEHTFQVPVDGCSHQNIRLVAKSGQYSKRIWSRTNSVNLERVE